MPVWSDGACLWTDGFSLFWRGDIRRPIEKQLTEKTVAKAKIDSLPVYSQAIEHKDFPHYAGIFDSLDKEPTETKFKVNIERLALMLKAFKAEGFTKEIEITVTETALRLECMDTKAIVLKIMES
jgi:hypothetical protein